MYAHPMKSFPILLALASHAFAGSIIPCAIGSGDDNGCSYCNDTQIVDLQAWNIANRVTNFDMPTAASKTGGGYDVWWNIKQADPGCRILITEPYDTDKGSLNPKLSGNVVLSVAHGGCYFAHVGSSFSAGFCCGSGDCSTAGANPAVSNNDKKRALIFGESTDALKARAWQNANPYTPKEPGKPGIQCTTPSQIGDTYTRAGTQQISGQSINCNGGESCSLSPSMSVMASTSLTNDKSWTHTESNGEQVSFTAGINYVATATTTVGWSKDWSDAITGGTSTSTTDTLTKTLSLNVGLVPGPNFNLWFTPTLNCRMLKMSCNGQEITVEKCEPIKDGLGNPVGNHGVITIG